MYCVPIWLNKIQDKEKSPQCIYSLCYNIDGSQLLVTAAQDILVYRSIDGYLLRTLKGHKENIFCLTNSSNGHFFASGAADKLVILWTSKFEPLGKYNHNDGVQCMAFNPVNHNVLSCSSFEFGLYYLEQKSVQKFKTSHGINTCAWSSDGQSFALGFDNGNISICNNIGEEFASVEVENGHSVWALTWLLPRNYEGEEEEILCVTDWGKHLSFYKNDGTEISKKKKIELEALTIRTLCNDLYLLIGGCKGKCFIYSSDGIKLTELENNQSWIWSSVVHPSSTYLAIGCQDGTLAYYKIEFSVIHGLYQEKYAFRENMTDVVIQDLISNKKVKIKCRDLVQKIAIYKNLLAVQLSMKIITYELSSIQAPEMHYRVKEKMNENTMCNLLVVCSNNLVLCDETRLQCLSLTGAFIREWNVDSVVKYLKVIGGFAEKEQILVGLDNGQVLMLKINSSKVNLLFDVTKSVRCLDVNISMDKITVVDSENKCSFFDIRSKKLLHQELEITSVSWNSKFPDMVCFSGRNIFNIKVNNFPAYQQRINGQIIGMYGSKIFALNESFVSVVEVALSVPLYQYLEKKLFSQSYRIACLNVTDSDWKILARESLDNFNFQIAKKAFAHIKEIKYIDLITQYEDMGSYNDKDKYCLLADILAYEGKFKEAARIYQKWGYEHKAFTMFTDLRMFDMAQEFISINSSKESFDLTIKRAEWAMSIEEYKVAAELYISAEEYVRAIDIMVQNCWTEMLLQLGRQIDKAEETILGRIGDELRKLGDVDSAAEMYSKMGKGAGPDMVTLQVEAHNWDQAFLLAEKNPNYAPLVYLPYAEWLAENDKFIDAQKAFLKGGQPERAFKVLEILTENAVDELRFHDASYYYWLLSRQCLNIASNSEENVNDIINNFCLYDKYATIYYAYNIIHRYMEDPFMSYQPETLFNTSCFLMNETKEIKPKGVSKFAILYTLSKQALNMQAYKLARHTLNELKKLRIPKKFQNFVELATLSIRAKPFHDNEILLLMCYRCLTYNPPGIENCVTCKHKFIFSNIKFDVLPLIEFKIEDNISDTEAVKLIQSFYSSMNDQEQESQIVNNYILNEGEHDTSIDPFTYKLMSFEKEDTAHHSVVVNKATLESLDINSVVVCKWPKPLKFKYYKNLLPGFSVTSCESCFKMFHSDEYEIEVLRLGHCPFCRTPDLRVLEKK
ncbi:intraflagellar transport protein 122 homolog [Daktulosphaira vitifoliae]|uniref:intraflagellar transport protein 122 homolog n=1 Tax=Daktulosphaira vitifoliae TaxID=58002 RepID=UPI0021AA48FE|nr:intraflagellar transport protein 122 homolog [Daktulosphaira vitifoliae]